ncbi:MAG TPA: hypothetical protein VFV87_13600 [Pirellulaceae bacterium]|nr:hypothetical protein [Pirellulaceae bacterium]
MSESRCRRTIYVSVLALSAGAALTGETVSAARLLKAEIEVDGKLVLQTAYSDDGTEQVATVWRYLARHLVAAHSIRGC